MDDVNRLRHRECLLSKCTRPGQGPVQKVYHGERRKNKPFGALAPELKGGERLAIDGRPGFESRRRHYRCATVSNMYKQAFIDFTGGAL